MSNCSNVTDCECNRAYCNYPFCPGVLKELKRNERRKESRGKDSKDSK